MIEALKTKLWDISQKFDEYRSMLSQASDPQLCKELAGYVDYFSSTLSHLKVCRSEIKSGYEARRNAMYLDLRPKHKTDKMVYAIIETELSELKKELESVDAIIESCVERFKTIQVFLKSVQNDLYFLSRTI